MTVFDLYEAIRIAMFVATTIGTGAGLIAAIAMLQSKCSRHLRLVEARHRTLEALIVAEGEVAIRALKASAEGDT